MDRHILGGGKKWLFKIVVYLSISIGLAFILTNQIIDKMHISRYKAETVVDKKIDVIEGNFLSPDSANMIMMTNYQDIITFSICRISDMSYITEIPVDYSIVNMQNHRIYKKDIDKDGYEDLLFGYCRNESLYICIMKPKNYSKKDSLFEELFVAKREEGKNLKNFKNAMDLYYIDFMDFNKDSVLDLLLSIGTGWGRPRELAVMDIKAKRIIKKVKYPSVSCTHISIEKYFIINYFACYNGITADGRKDTFSAVCIYDSMLDVKKEYTFPGYSMQLILYDSLLAQMNVIVSSNWNMDENPTKLLRIDVKSGKIIHEKILGKVKAEGNTEFSKNLRFSAFDVGSMSLNFYDGYGEITHSIKIYEDKKKPVLNIKNFYYAPLKITLVACYNDQETYFFDMNGKQIAKIPGNMLDIQSDGLIRFYEKDILKNYNLSRIIYNKQFDRINLLIMCISIFVFYIAIIGAEHSAKYFLMLNIWNVFSKASPEAIFILFKGKIVMRNHISHFYEDAVKKINLNISFQKQDVIRLNEKYIEIKIIPFKIFSIDFVGLTLHDITSEIMNENYKMLLNATSLIAHDIKNGITSIKATKYIFELKGNKFSPEVTVFLDKLEETNKNILASCDNIMSMIYGNIKKEKIFISAFLDGIIYRFNRKIKVYAEAEDIETETEPNLFKYALLNFIDNAVHEVTVNNSGDVMINVRQMSKGILIEVCNTVPDLSESEIEKIMKGGYTTKEGGHGFGFAMSKTVIETIGGRVAMESSKGAGVKVKIYI